MSDFASLCFLSFNRPTFIDEAVRSAVDNAGYPCEVILHDDGSHYSTRSTLLQLLDDGVVSRLVLNPEGHNEGVGVSFNRCVALSAGDPVIKLDQDLLFQPDWLARTVALLKADMKIAAAGLFKYPVDPVDWRKMQLDSGSENVGFGYHYVQDFVGSAVAIPRDIWRMHGPWPEHSDAFAEDVEFKTMMQRLDYKLALPDEDLASNRGFGYGPSTVCVAPGHVQEINHGPALK